MTRAFREIERVQSRALAALRFVDAATRAPIPTALTLRVLDGRARLVRSAGGDWVVASWTELAEHEAAFAAPPAAPPIGSVPLRLTVADPTGLHLPRALSLGLPRDADPTHAAEAGSLFRAVEVPMYPAPGAAAGANWSVLRVSLRESGGDALGGALLRVRRNGDVLGRGLTDGRGEGLVTLVGVPMVTFGDDDEAVVVTEIAVTVEAIFDPSAGTRMPEEDVAAGRRAPVPIVDPDTLEDAAATLPSVAQPIAIAARRRQTLAMTLDLP
jgi:hypothetical protein